MARALVFGVVVVASLVGCAPGAEDGGTGRGGSDGGAEPDGSPPIVGGDRCRDDGECGAGRFCSAGSVCIAEGSCAVDADCDAGHVCDPSTGACEIGSECGTETFATEAIPPNLLIVLDRSCSMHREAVVGGGVSKWQAAIESLVELTTRHDGTVRWGLTLFPDLGGGECGQGAIPIPVGDANEPAIQMLLTDALDPGDPYHCQAGPCVTNIDTAMEQAAGDPSFDDTSRASYALLVTDGSQSGSCRGGSDERTFAAIEGLRGRGIDTFVVGFGNAVDEAALSRFATLGGTALPAMPSYYQANDPAELLTAFDAIVSGVVSCDYAVPDMPTDLSMVTVFFDGSRTVDRDESHAAGWDFDPATGRLTFYGGPCDDLRSGAARDVDVVFGCTGPTLE